MKEAITDHFARRLVLIGLVLFGVQALAACGGGDETPSPATARTFEVTATEYAFKAPDRATAGETTLRFRNEGRKPHELQVMRFNEGALIHQFMGTLHQGEGLEAALRMVSPVGGVEPVGPGQTAEAKVDLREGEYLLISLVRDPADGVADAHQGMVKPLTVRAAR